MATYSQKQIEACWNLLNKGASISHICECFQCGKNNALALQRQTIEKFGKVEQKQRPIDIFLNQNEKRKVDHPKAVYSNVHSDYMDNFFAGKSIK